MTTATTTTETLADALQKGPLPQPPTPEDKARKAISYLLARIMDDPYLAWHFVGTESYAKLIDALSSLTGQTSDFLEKRYMPRASRCCRRCEEAEAEGRAA